jgi:hypothetical protein
MLNLEVGGQMVSVHEREAIAKQLAADAARRVSLAATSGPLRVLRIGLAAEDLAEAAPRGALRPRVPDKVSRRDPTPR